MHFLSTARYVALLSITLNVFYASSITPLPDVECGVDELTCEPSGRCIPNHWKCDGTPDCEDGSDEPASCPGGTVCKVNQFMCKVSKKCIPQGWLCDGEPDCSRYANQTDTSDEDPTRCGLDKCPWNNVRCGNLSQCVHISEFCDGKQQCNDSFDEGKFCENNHCLTMGCVHDCRETPRGAMCFCLPGYQVYNRTSCADSDECELDGVCDQICHNKVGTFECSCISGYTLVGKTKCKAINVPELEDPSLVFISSKGIRRLELSGEEWPYPGEPPDIPGIRYSMSLEVDHRNRSLCFLQANVTAETAHSAIVCLNIDDPSESWTLPPSPLFSLTSMTTIAQDWVSGNWYLLDLTREMIYLCTKNMFRCLVLIDVGLSKARGMALDPTSGYMFFTKWGSESPSLERVLLDGTERIVLVNKTIVYPYGLTADLANKQVYWVDTYLDVVERIDYDGKNRKIIRKGYPVQNLFDVTVFENNLYVSSWRNQSVTRLNKFGKDDYHVMANVSRSISIHVFHRQRQPDVAHPCKSDHYGGCDHICIPLWKGGVAHAACYCQIGYRLVNERHCHKIEMSTFLLFGQLGMIKGLSLEGKKTEEQVMVPITVSSEPVSLDVDVSTKNVYYSDFHHFMIWKVVIGSENRPEGFISTGEKTRVGGLAVDWMGRNLYWTDSSRATILVAKLSDPTLRTTVVSESNKHFKSITLDPGRGYMYWSQWHYQMIHEGVGGISMAWMDGSNQRTLVSSGLHWPNGLTLDTLSNTLYWCDTFLNSIERLKIDDPSDRKVLFQGTNSENPYGLAYFDNFIFWTEYNKKTVRRMDLAKNNITTLSYENRHLYELKIYDVTSLNRHITLDKRCEECSGLCLPIPKGKNCLNTSDLVKTASNETTISLGCPPNHFNCIVPVNGSPCIHMELVCDGYRHCINGTDEDTSPTGPCANFTCAEEMFQCDETNCLTKSELCDGVVDCFDGTDESSCKEVPCLKHQFKCELGRCIPLEWVCDGDPDCGRNDTSDESQNCTFTLSPDIELDCITSGFRCNNSNCISFKYVCDGEDDCSDNSDETNCPSDMCDSPHQFTCRHMNGTKAGCIPVSEWCDGKSDCPNGTDEVLCPPPCGHKELRCFGKPQTCYPISFRCDGKLDCDLGEDEAGCECDRAMGQGNLNDKFQCDQSTCIDWEMTCDGKFDCPMGQDEGSFCPAEGESNPSVTDCDRPNRLCDNSTVCVSVQELCDGKAQCADGSDEGLLCEEEQCRTSLVCSHFCHNAPEGVVCWCPRHLFLQPDNVTCRSFHPCSAWGACSQRCQQMGNRHKCSCNEGYTLQTDGFSCKTDEGGVPMVIYSNRHELRGVDLRTHSVKPLISSLKNTIAIDFLHNSTSDLIFWTDVIDDKIYRGTLIGGSIGNIEVVVQTGLATAEGLAVDWIGLNLYWVESNLDQIEVAKINGSFRRTLVAGDMESPRAIALDPRYGLLFWSDWDTNAPRIERCSLAGDSRKIVVNIDRVSDGAWPNGLTLDYQLERIYWIDARSDSIHTVRYDGSGHHMVMRGHETLSHPFSISLFEEHVYWTDWRTNSVVRANKWNGTQVSVLQRSLSQPFDIQILHPSRQPKAKFNPCGYNNGNCSHLCLLSLNGTRKCDCPHVMRLASDNKTCIVNEKVLVMSRLNEIRGVDLYQPYYHTIPAISLPQTQTPVQMDYVASTKEIYWAEAHTIEVRKTPLTGGTVQTILDTGIEQPMGFAIDWISGNMFIGCASSNNIKIVASTLQGEYLTTVYSNQGTQEMQTPQSRMIKCLAVDPYRGNMYWSEWEKNGQSRINSANMDGSNVTTLFFEVNRTSAVITSLTIDYDLNRIYWVNGGSQSIQWLDVVNGSVTYLIMRKGSSPLAATLYKDLIYYSDQNSQAIYSCDKLTGANHTLVRNNTGIVNSVKIYDPVAQGGTNPCSVGRGHCSHLCLPVSLTQRVCACATGYTRDPANYTNCIGTAELVVYSMNWEMRGLALDSNDSSVLGPISRVSMATSIDFNAGQDYLYWGDSEHGTITRIHRDGTGRQIVIGHLDNSDVSHVTSDWFSGLAVDWAADNIYWTDMKHKAIEVSRSNGSYQYVVVHEGLDIPGSVAVDPSRGLLFWADRGRDGSLSRAALDGSARKYIILPPYPGQITDIALHYSEMKVYWCDANSNIIGRVNYNGTESETVLNHSMTTPFAITIHDSKIYWIDVSEEKGSLKVMDLTVGKPKTLLSGLGDSLKDIQVFSNARELMGTNPCSVKNGGCKELCLFNGTHPVCACSHGKVALDGKSCEDYDALLMYSAISKIDSIHLTDASNLNAPHPPIHSRELMRNAIGLAYDYSTSTLFYSDIQKGSINAVHFNGTNHRLLLQRQGSVEGLAYQVSSNTLFWTCNNDATIYSVDLTSAVLIPKTVIKLTINDKPRGIVVESCHGHMYWTNWNSQHPGIHRAFTSGYHQEAIITTHIKMPNAIALDESEAKLYWGDARLDKIEKCDLNGENRIVLTPAKAEHVFSMAIYGEFIFWTDWVQHAVLRANKYTGQDLVWLRRDISRPMGIVAIANISYDCVLNGCLVLNGGCSEVCTPDKNGHPLCTCKPGRTLDVDLRSCLPDLPPGENQTCSLGFMCANSGCIPYHLTCDGVNQCADGSDEETIYCATRNCKDGFFRCHNGRCIPNSRVCDGENHCGDNADESNCTCSNVTHFRCASGKCIPIKFRCDQDPDCPDVSDEIGCPLKECIGGVERSSSMIHCNHTTACIHPYWICDGQNDCWDNSDEEDCPPEAAKPGSSDFKCPSNKFTCASGQCIKLDWKCDGEEDCNDGTDEKDCTYVCRSDQFQCQNLDCIPLTWVCDGSPDCADETDENQLCKERECRSVEFRCNSSGRCIPEAWVCDGMGDCQDKSDEEQCQSVSLCRRQNNFECANKRCLVKDFYCDGEDDCGDNSDEPESCSVPMAPPTKSCGPGYLRCANSRCIRSDLTCNLKDDCGDNSDELPTNTACLGNITCNKKDQFECNNKLCVNTTLLCDGKNDCGDFSDEDRCNINECLEKVCRHECVDLPVGYRCECPTGFRSQGSLCVDIDECSEISPCSQICANTHGSYKCSCNSGYELYNNTCKQNSSEKPELIFSNKYYVRKLGLAGESNILIHNLTNAVALDFDWLEKCVYWSDVTALQSSIKRWCPGFTSHQVVHSATLQNPDGLAVDWVGRNLYWCDKGLDTIEVSHLNGSYRKVLIRNNLSEPRAIALHPHRGVMFWSDWGEEPHIGKAGMDGSDQKRIVYTNLGWPNALTIDYETDTLYWADAREDYIARSDLLGNNVVHILNREIEPNLRLHHVFAITVWEDYIYWTDWETMSVERCNRVSQGDCKSMIKLVHRPMDIRLYHQYRQKPMWNNPCEDGGGCPTLCLLAPGGTRVCACPENYIEVPGLFPVCWANCTSSQFQCETTYKCIPFWWKCDTQDDCGDNSDEPPDCRKFGCLPGQFQCNNQQCIHPSQLCNGINDCRDESDEVNCNQYTCMETQFKCKGEGNHSDVCIPSTKRCDGTTDCHGGEDEAGCLPKTCPPNQMMCGEDSKHCIPSVWACDGARDCGESGWDESPELCSTRKCSDGMFQCSSGRCIPPSWKCDGTSDCLLGEDEPDTCFKTSCQPTYFRCNNSKCLPGRWRCDFEDDCGDNSDEINCVPRNCSESEFRCKNQQCIPGGLKCDGEENCPDGSDEENCNETCSDQEFMCLKPKLCIYKKFRCDGYVDCIDGSDELGCGNECPLPGYWRCKESEPTLPPGGGPCYPSHWRCDNDPECPDASDESPALCLNMTCSPHRFRCDNHKCIQMSLVCDGRDSCGDNSDETSEACELDNACPKEGFKCRNGHCISRHSVCDGFNDCVDNTDEHNCPPHECKELKCSQLCLPKHDFKGHKCACDHGYIPSNSNKCVPIGDFGVLALVSEIGVRELNTLKLPRPGSIRNNLHSGFHSIVIGAAQGNGGRAADITYINNDIVLFAAQQSSIVSSSLYSNSSSSSDVKTVLMEDVGDVVGLAVDWIGQRIYFAQSLSMRICVTTLQGNLTKTIYHTNPSHPLDIVVSPQRGEIYWSEGGEVSRIMVGRCDGGGKDVLVKGGLAYPTGLAVDHPAQRLYWADPKLRSVYYIHLAGPLSKLPGDLSDPERTIVFRGDGDNEMPHRLEVFSDNLFISMWTDSVVIIVDKLARSKEVINYKYGGFKATQLIYLHPLKYSNLSSPCSGNPCHQSALCLIAHGGSNYSCLCPDNMETVQNTTTNQVECVKAGCPLPCFVGGTCYMTSDGPRCACTPLYGGPRCSVYRCADKCKNNGICYAEETAKSPSFEPPPLKCKCVGDWMGDDCSIKNEEKETCTNPCLNGGICKLGQGSSHPVCFCPRGFSGTWCEHCMERECKHGICYRDVTDMLACNCTAGFKGPHCSQIDCDNYCNKGNCSKSEEGPVCACPPGYSGKRCDRDLCAGLCHNSGKCVADDSRLVRCACLEGWAGEHCEVDLCLCHCGDAGCPCGVPKPDACNRPIDICHPHKCNNNSTCVIVGSQPVCRCKPGWGGTECEVSVPYPNACTDYCLHGGVCTLVGNITYCYCPAGWRGLRCEENISCKNFCFNGGTCIKPISDDKAPTCKCLVGYVGRRCQTSVLGTPDSNLDPSDGTSISDEESSPFTKLLLLTIALLLLILITVMATYCVIVQRRRRPFSHVRMMENVEISNPMYQPGQLINDVDNLATEFSIDPDNSNFGNPVYESVYNCGGGGGLREEERRGLLGLDESQGSDL